jgi:hypothetical protein
LGIVSFGGMALLEIYLRILGWGLLLHYFCNFHELATPLFELADFEEVVVGKHSHTNHIQHYLPKPKVKYTF